MMTININAQRGTRVSTPRPKFDTTGTSVLWTVVPVDADAAMGPSAWSPPI